MTPAQTMSVIVDVQSGGLVVIDLGARFQKCHDGSWFGPPYFNHPSLASDVTHNA